MKFFLMITLIFSWGLNLNAQEKRVALVIGNGAYRFNTTLKNPVNDAQDIEKALVSAGFQVTLLKDADRPKMEKAVRDFGNTLKDPEAVGLFYYSGHGAQAGGQNYLLPVDANINDADELPYMAVDAELVLAKMRSSGNKLNLVFLDACRNNPFPGASKSAERGLSVVKVKVPESIIVYATDPGAVALDGTGRNSPFTQALLAHINTPGLGVTQLMLKVTAAVKQTTGGSQTPWISSNLSQEFVFYSSNSNRTAISPQTTPTPTGGDFVPAVGSLSISLSSAGTIEVLGQKYELPSAGKKSINNVIAEDVIVKVTYKDGRTETQSVKVEVNKLTEMNFKYRPSQVVRVNPSSPPLNDNSLEMVKVEGGKFMAGRTKTYKGLETSVSSFNISKYEVTLNQFKEFVDTTGYLTTAESIRNGGNIYVNGTFANKSDSNWKNTYVEQKGSEPVVLVTWYDAIEFCNWLSKKEGYEPSYSIDKDKKDSNNTNQDDKVNWVVSLIPGTNGYRLPTEAQSEFASLGGVSSRGTQFSGSDSPESVGWILSNSGGKPQAVGKKTPNELGIYDMTGNVWEWCWDWYSGKTIRGVNPLGPSSGARKVIRGGAFTSNSDYYSLYSLSCEADRPQCDIGFRVVRP